MAQGLILIKNLVNVETAVKRVAVKIGDQIQDAYESAITKFYSDYSPHIYERTYSLYEGSKGVGGYGVNYKKTGKFMFDAGINVDPSNYSGDPYVKSPPHGLAMSVDEIFSRSFEKGIHGFTSYERSQYNKDKKKGDWNYMKWSAPKKSSPPINKMNADFKKIANQDVPGMLEAELDAMGAFLE